MTLYGYVRTSKDEINADNQYFLLTEAGVSIANVKSDAGVSGATGASTRRGWYDLESKLQPGDTLVVAELARIGRTYHDVMHTIDTLHRRGVRLRSLAQTEQQWCKYLDADPESTEYFIGDLLARFAAWAASQERQAISRRTKTALERARAEGKQLGRPKSLDADQELGVQQALELGQSISAIARNYKVDRKTIRAIRDTLETPEDTDMEPRSALHGPMDAEYLGVYDRGD